MKKSPENLKKLKKIFWCLPTIIYIFLIFTMSFKPAPKLPSFEQVDKFAHGAAYALLAFLLFFPLSRMGLKKNVLLTVSLAVLVGAVDEFLQSFNPSRTASLYDLMADGVGALIGAEVSLRIIGRKKTVNSI